MLIPRVTSALVKFLSPVASSANNALDLGKSAVRELRKRKDPAPNTDKVLPKTPHEQNQENPQSFQQHKHREPLLKLVTPPPTEEEDLSPTPVVKPSTVVQLFNYFLKNKNEEPKPVVQAAAYGAAIKEQKRSTLFKKGTILDTKAE